MNSLTIKQINKIISESNGTLGVVFFNPENVDMNNFENRIRRLFGESAVVLDPTIPEPNLTPRIPVICRIEEIVALGFTSDYEGKMFCKIF